VKIVRYIKGTWNNGNITLQREKNKNGIKGKEGKWKRK